MVFFDRSIWKLIYKNISSNLLILERVKNFISFKSLKILTKSKSSVVILYEGIIKKESSKFSKESNFLSLLNDSEISGFWLNDTRIRLLSSFDFKKLIKLSWLENTLI